MLLSSNLGLYLFVALFIGIELAVITKSVWAAKWFQV
jgi:hypothetical protein